MSETCFPSQKTGQDESGVRSQVLWGSGVGRSFPGQGREPAWPQGGGLSRWGQELNQAVSTLAGCAGSLIVLRCLECLASRLR